MTQVLEAGALDRLFRTARSQNQWRDEPVSQDQLRALYELVKWGPTSVNSFPLRLVFVTTPGGRARLAPMMSEGNRAKVMTAPVTAILGYDLQFVDRLPQRFPHRDLRPMFADKPALIEATAFRNGSLQGGYFILAARSLGLDCGPMSGFDGEAVERGFFPEGGVKPNFICALGHGDPAGIHDRLPRPAFDEVCRIE